MNTDNAGVPTPGRLLAPRPAPARPAASLFGPRRPEPRPAAPSRPTPTRPSRGTALLVAVDCVAAAVAAIPLLAAHPPPGDSGRAATVLTPPVLAPAIPLGPPASADPVGGFAPAGGLAPTVVVAVAALVAMAVVALGARGGLYRPGPWTVALDEAPRLLRYCLLAWLLAAAVISGTDPPRSLGWQVLLTALAVHALLAYAGRAAVHRLRRRARRRHPRSTLVVGAGPAGRRLATVLGEHPEYGMRPVGLVEPTPPAGGLGGGGGVEGMGGVVGPAAPAAGVGAGGLAVGAVSLGAVALGSEAPPTPATPPRPATVSAASASPAPPAGVGGLAMGSVPLNAVVVGGVDATVVGGPPGGQASVPAPVPIPLPGVGPGPGGGDGTAGDRASGAAGAPAAALPTPSPPPGAPPPLGPPLRCAPSPAPATPMSAAQMSSAQTPVTPVPSAQTPAVPMPASAPVAPPLPLLHSYEDVIRAVIQNTVRDAVFTRDPAEAPQLAALARLLVAQGCAVWLPGGAPGQVVERLGAGGRAPGHLSGHLWGFACRRLDPPPPGRLGAAGKRALDVAVAGCALLVTGPLLLACALAVRLADGPGVLFRQERVGHGGRPFVMLKFRTLRPADDHESATLWSVARDRRVSLVGRLLRRSSLDELPQLWNVLRGDMSLVGPRPERPYFVRKFSQDHPGYAARHRMPVGVTGLAQVHGLRGDTSIEDRARFDNLYIETWTLWQDVRILLRTAGSLFRFGGS
nr:sugar transferase [Streptomyces sp. SAJ15]